MVLTPSIAIGGVDCSVQGVATTGRSLAMSLELSVGGVRDFTVGNRLTPELAVGVGKRCALRDEAISVRLPSRLSFEAADGRATVIFSTVLRRVGVGVRVGAFGRRAAAVSQAPFAGDAVVFPE